MIDLYTELSEEFKVPRDVVKSVLFPYIYSVTDFSLEELRDIAKAIFSKEVV